jgi:hypothetical protein
LSDFYIKITVLGAKKSDFFALRTEP